ncbi:universal stress protein [candidate division KSB1 bacterium]|nr:universal stress protein [candidate division KSB1 bacterium]NIR69781.1 universal stress protein [candidate division KSB1 bacterium]NIS22964.1 universal stress protein [candidate division KSB1 bacterium]NIT69821.1 universal stress protein [candidate division KSB1 bacterium]NIU23495.1 universal stress protein [candidate division KSB1 bacterium]
MKIFKKILCPVDFSDASRDAFEYAKAFAETFDSALVMLHVSANITEAYTALMPDFPNYGVHKEEDLIEQFNEFSNDWSGELNKVIRAGTPYLEILEYAKEKEVDLIILGAKGLSKFERLFIGSTGEKVTRKSDCPVLTVHSKPKGLPIENILVPIDFSPLSYAILPIVATIASKFQAEINLLHVVEIGQRVDRDAQVKEYDYFERVKAKLADEWELPQEFEKIETKKFIRHHVGSAGYGIMQFAQDWDIDLIAMATHGRSGLSKVLMGSVTEKVIKIAPCPVLSIRSETAG